ncbi:YaaA family protein [Frondihabitans cladoniiphilus]|uniref:Peroxide stress protein YaaA n=1 Tax=Frondihabitans cladoniiphilus TaxID=715785 RepID=A0ABP8VMG5_9MICO
MVLFLLPPSETKRGGGVEGTTLDHAALSFPELTRARRSAVAAVVRLSRDVDASMKALKLGATLRSEVERNRLVKKSPTMPALLRYTGVVYDPIDAEHLDEGAWLWAAEHVAIHSALFGVVRATDPVPAYRLSHDSRLAELPLRGLWSRPVAGALAELGEPVVDLRSEGYVDLGAAPAGSVYVRIVSDEGGRRRALNHFNKKTKGTLVARLLAARPVFGSVDDFVSWARADGIVVEWSGDELVIVSESVLGG